jgi:hypothetical protein
VTKTPSWLAGYEAGRAGLVASQIARLPDDLVSFHDGYAIGARVAALEADVLAARGNAQAALSSHAGVTATQATDPLATRQKPGKHHAARASAVNSAPAPSGEAH